MLSSITPLGERGRNNRFWITAPLFVIGSVAGGAIVGLVAGACGALLSVPDTIAASVIAISALIAVVLDRRVFGSRLPTIRRQVDELWLTRYRGWVYALGFGAQLGAGIVTIVTTAAVYLMVVLSALTGSALGGLFVGATFGAVRGLSIFAASRVRDPDALRRLHGRVARTAPVAEGVTVAAEGTVAAAAIAALLR